MKVGITIAAILALVASPQHQASSFSPIVQRNTHTLSPSPSLKSKLSLSYDNENNSNPSFEEEGGEKNQYPEETQYTPPPLSPEQINSLKSTRKLDPLLASLTRTDESMRTTPTTNAPLIGEIPLDGSITVLIPAAVIGVLGFVYSFVVAFNARDAIVEGVTKVGQDLNIPEMKYTETKVEEGVCRGLCSSQEQDLDNLKKFLGKISKQ